MVNCAIYREDVTVAGDLKDDAAAADLCRNIASAAESGRLPVAHH